MRRLPRKSILWALVASVSLHACVLLFTLYFQFQMRVQATPRRGDDAANVADANVATNATAEPTKAATPIADRADDATFDKDDAISDASPGGGVAPDERPAGAVDSSPSDHTTAGAPAIGNHTGGVDPEGLDAQIAGSPVTVRQTRDLMARTQARVHTAASEANMEELNANAQRLAAMPTEHVAGAASLVESAAGVRDTGRAFAPRPGVAGAFDPHSASLYDIVKRQANDGSIVYEHTYVDRAGRTLATTRPSQEMTPEEVRAARIFEMARQNPNLRILVDTARKILEPDDEPTDAPPKP